MTLQAIPFNTIEEARAYAIEESIDHPERFYYLRFNNVGTYLVEWLGLSNDDETLLETYKNGFLENVVK